MARIVSFAAGSRNARRFGVFRAVRALNRPRSLTGREREHDREDERQRTTARTTRCGDHGTLESSPTPPRASRTPSCVPMTIPCSWTLRHGESLWPAQRRRRELGGAPAAACMLLGALSTSPSRNLRQQPLADRGRAPAPDRRDLRHRGRYPRQRARAASHRTAEPQRAPGPDFGRLAEAAAHPRLAQVPPRGEKLAYIARHWDGHQLFLADGRVEIDSNSAENLARLIALNRKSALFASHEEGAATWARIASLIETAKLNGVEPYAWLKATLEAIAASHPNDRIDDFMTWAFNPAST